MLVYTVVSDRVSDRTELNFNALVILATVCNISEGLLSVVCYLMSFVKVK